MNEQDILRIVEQGEGDEIEFKEDLGNLQSLAKTMCAFGNTKGGIIVFGVDNENRINGIRTDLDLVQQKISSVIENIYPTPSINIDKGHYKNKQILILSIQPAYLRSYFTYQGAIYIRVGSTTRRLEGQAQLEFLRQKQILTFDEGVTPAIGIDDIDPRKIMEYMSRKGHGTYLDSHGLENFLLNTMLATKTVGLNIKNSAVLLFGKEPTKFFPQSEIKLVRFLGKEPVRILDHALVQDDLLNSIERSISFIVRNIRRGMEIGVAPERKDIFEYPEKVFREAIVNAVVHRDYFSRDSTQVSIFDDRIEVINPGSLLGSFKKELFGYVSVQRNPIVYRFLRDIGYVEGYGTGIPRMRAWMREANLKDPVFRLNEDFFHVTLYNASGSTDQTLTKRQERIIEILSREEGMGAKDLSKILDISVPSVIKDLNSLIDQGSVIRIGRFKGAYYRLKEKNRS